MPYETLAVTTADRISTITVNRPDKRNALSIEVVAELEDAFSRVESDCAIRALIVTGAGDKAFVAGADINELAALPPAELRKYALRGQSVFRGLEIDLDEQRQVIERSGNRCSERDLAVSDIQKFRDQESRVRLRLARRPLCR